MKKATAFSDTDRCALTLTERKSMNFLTELTLREYAELCAYSDLNPSFAENVRIM